MLWYELLFYATYIVAATTMMTHAIEHRSNNYSPSFRDGSGEEEAAKGRLILACIGILDACFLWPSNLKKWLGVWFPSRSLAILIFMPI